MSSADLADDARHRLELARRPRRRHRRVVVVDAVERRREAVGIALAAHLAVGDDVDAGAFLVADRDDRRVVLRLFEERAVDPPQLLGADARRDQLAQPPAIDQPIGLGVAPDQGRRQ
jgi:hypothetical protein